MSPPACTIGNRSLPGKQRSTVWHPATTSDRARRGLQTMQSPHRYFAAAARIQGGWHRPARRPFEHRRNEFEFCSRLGVVHLAQREHGVPERKPAPSFVGAHRSQVLRASLQSLFAAIEPSGQKISPKADAAFAAAKETGIAFTRVFGGACQATHQAFLS